MAFPGFDLTDKIALVTGAGRGIGRDAALALAPENVHVNDVGPTATETVMYRERFANEDWRRMVLARIPAGRFCTPADVVGAVVYLASPAADMVTGQILLVDGGWTAQ